MSLKPILNDVNALDNKSLNLYANTITANVIYADINTDNIECNTLKVNVSADIENLTVNDTIITENLTSDNIECNTLQANSSADIENLTVNDTIITENLNVNDTVATENLTSSDTAILRGNVIPSNISTANDVLANVDGVGSLSWVPLQSIYPLPRVLGTLTEVTTGYTGTPMTVWQALSGTNVLAAGSFPFGATIEIEAIGTINFLFPSPGAITPTLFTFNFGALHSLNSNDLTFATSPASFNGVFKLKVKYVRVGATSLYATGIGYYTNTNGSTAIIDMGGGAVVAPYDELQNYPLTLDFTNGYTTGGGNANNWNCFALNIKQYNS